jgi:hypothetical protein
MLLVKKLKDVFIITVLKYVFMGGVHLDLYVLTTSAEHALHVKLRMVSSRVNRAKYAPMN